MDDCRWEEAQGERGEAKGDNKRGQTMSGGGGRKKNRHSALLRSLFIFSFHYLIL